MLFVMTTVSQTQDMDFLKLLLWSGRLRAFVGMDSVNVMYRLNLKSVALPVPEIIGGP